MLSPTLERVVNERTCANAHTVGSNQLRKKISLGFV